MKNYSSIGNFSDQMLSQRAIIVKMNKPTMSDMSQICRLFLRHKEKEGWRVDSSQQPYSENCQQNGTGNSSFTISAFFIVVLTVFTIRQNYKVLPSFIFKIVDQYFENIVKYQEHNIFNKLLCFWGHSCYLLDEKILV